MQIYKAWLDCCKRGDGENEVQRHKHKRSRRQTKRRELAAIAAKPQGQNHEVERPRVPATHPPFVLAACAGTPCVRLPAKPSYSPKHAESSASTNQATLLPPLSTQTRHSPIYRKFRQKFLAPPGSRGDASIQLPANLPAVLVERIKGGREGPGRHVRPVLWFCRQERGMPRFFLGGGGGGVSMIKRQKW